MSWEVNDRKSLALLASPNGGNSDIGSLSCGPRGPVDVLNPLQFSFCWTDKQTEIQ